MTQKKFRFDRLMVVVFVFIIAIMGLVGFNYLATPSEREASGLSLKLATLTFERLESFPMAGRYQSSNRVGNNSHELVTETGKVFPVMATHISIAEGAPLYRVTGRVGGKDLSGYCIAIKNSKVGTCLHDNKYAFGL